MRTSKPASAASRAGVDEVGAEDGAELGADEHSRAALGGGAAAPLGVAAVGADVLAGPGGEGGEGDAVFLVGLLHAGGAQVLQDHGGEVALRAEAHPLVGQAVDQLIVLADAEDAVGGEALDGERAGHADLLRVLIRLVVEILELRPGGDGGVDLLLPGDACLPPAGVDVHGRDAPFRVRLDGDLPLLPLLVERRVELFAERLKGLLPLLPNDVDLGVVRDRLQRDVRDALVDEAVADVVPHRLARRKRVSHLPFLNLAFPRIGQEVVRVAGAHDAGTGQCKGDARGVDGDPAAAPLFGDCGGCAGAAGWIENEVAGISSHQHTTFRYLRRRLNDIQLFVGKVACSSVCPHVAPAFIGPIAMKPSVSKAIDSHV
jgi:hypothetical protein